MRSCTPTVTTSSSGPTSPPETPVSGTFTSNHKNGTSGRQVLKPNGNRPGGQAPAMQPLDGVGSQFSSTRRLDPDELSPRSPSPSEHDSVLSVSPPRSSLSDVPEILSSGSQNAATRIVVEETFEIVEYDGEYDNDVDPDCDHLPVLRPSGYEYPGSEHSRSPSPSLRLRPTDSEFLEALRSMNCSESEESVLQDENSESEYDGDEDDDAQMMREIKRLRQEKRERRMTSASTISKRTVSERDSDSDREDLQPFDSGDTERRRVRRKTENRRSLLSAMSIPPEVIVELKEPSSDDEIIVDNAELLAQQPFWKYMDVDSE